MAEHNLILLPGDPEFEVTLHSAFPPGWQQFPTENSGFAFVARAGSGILEAVSLTDLTEYIKGGEYDERLEEIGEEDATNDNG